MLRKALPLLFIFTVVLLLYYPVLTTYYTQDHFLHFKVGLTDGSLKQFLNLFEFHTFEERGLAYYRPIFRDVLFHILYNSFGLNHIPYRILYFVIHFINISLVYIFIQKLFQKKQISFFVSFFFGISSANIGILYWGIEILGATMFIISTLILFIKFLETHKNKFLIFSLLTFLLALGSHEFGAIIPILLVGLILIYLPSKSIPINIFRLLPFFLIVIPYVFLDFTQTGYSSKDLQYSPVLNLKSTLNTLSWYTGWALGLPEMLVDFVLPGLKLNPNLIRYWGNYFLIIFPTFVISLAFLWILIIYLIVTVRNVLYTKKFLFLIFLFPLNLLPVLFFPFHKFTYYLSASLPAFWGTIGYILFNAYWHLKKKSPRLALMVIATFISSILLLNTTSILLGHSTYWAAQRGKIAEKIIKQVTSRYPTLPKGSVIYITNDPTYSYVAKDWGGSSKQASIILSGSDALQLIYKDPTLRVYYEDLEKLTTQDKNVYPLVAKIY